MVGAVLTGSEVGAGVSNKQARALPVIFSFAALHSDHMDKTLEEFSTSCAVCEANTVNSFTGLTQ